MNQITHSRTAFNPFNRNRALVFSVFAVALAVLSFHGALDDLALSKVRELMKESFGLLLVSRGINAAVSVLQTIEFKIPHISAAQVGQVLDPINDAAERLSVALTWAIGSLVLQDVMLKIASGWIFKWIFLAIAGLTVTHLLLAQSDRVRTTLVTTFGISHVALAQFQDFLIRTFVVATIFRFIVPAFAAASFLVSQTLVAPEIKEHTVELEQQAEGLSELGTQISTARDEVINEQKIQNEILTDDEIEDSGPEEETKPASTSSLGHAAAMEDVQTLSEHKLRLEGELASLQADLERLTDRIKGKEESLLTGVVEGFKRKFADAPREALAEASARVEQTEAEVNQLELELACIEERARGERCDPFLAEHREDTLGRLKTRMESSQAERRNQLNALQLEREEHLPKASEKPQGEDDSGWSDVIPGAVRNFLSDDSAERMEAAKTKIEELDREIAKAEALSAQASLELECVTRRIAGEACDSRDVDVQIQAEFDTLKTRLESHLPTLRAELASRQDVRERLQAEIAREEDVEKLKEERKQIETKIEENRAHFAQNDSELECAKQRVAGEDCKTVGTVAREVLTDATKAVGKGLLFAGETAGQAVITVTKATSRAFSRMSLGVLDRFKAIVDGAQEMVTGLVNTLILVVIENIVLPIIFLAIAVKGSVPIARGVMRISTSIREDTREALAAMDQALPGRTD